MENKVPAKVAKKCEDEESDRTLRSCVCIILI